MPTSCCGSAIRRVRPTIRGRSWFTPRPTWRGRRLPKSLPVSAITGEGLPELLDTIVRMAKAILPSEGAIVLNRRQAAEIEDARSALDDAAGSDQPEIQAECLRRARLAFDRLTGRAGIEDVLDALFGRFCLGK